MSGYELIRVKREWVPEWLLLLRRKSGDVHALEGNLDPEADMTKKEASLLLQVIAAEMRLTLDEDDEDCPTWPDEIETVALALYGGGE